MTTDNGSTPVGNPAPDAAPVAPTAPASTPAPDAPAAKFYDGFKDEAIKGYVQNKGFESPEAMANSYMNLEKLVGKDKVPMPKDDSDTEGWNRVYDALGRPKDASGYQLKVPEGDDGEFAKTAGNWFHKAGISQRQAEAISNEWNSYQAEQMKAVQAQAEAKGNADIEALKQEWGAAYGKNEQAAKVFAREFGLDEQKMAAIESVMGTKEFLKSFAAMGARLGEAATIGLDGKQPDGPMTPAAASQQIAALKNDKAWVAKYLSGDTNTRQEMEKLQRYANGVA